MKNLKDIKHVNEIRTANMEQIQLWLTQCVQSAQLTMTELWARESDLKELQSEK